MNASLFPRKSLLTLGVAFVLLAACMAAPTKPDGAANARSKLNRLQSDPQLASLAPLATKEADAAVTAAEKPQTDKALGAYLVFMADRKVDIAWATAESHLAVDQRKALTEEREAMRLQARTNEADSANRRAALAQADAKDQKRDADAARNQADAARNEADAAHNQAEVARNDAALALSAAADAQREAQRSAQELQIQIVELQAKETDRGLVLTLGDVLFASGTANLNTGGSNRLGKLAVFLNKYPERTAVIEGHTDSIGSEEYNQGLSERRADAVKSYLVGQGIGSNRLTASGKGKSSPVGDNGSATGRQQNRRVEVIIDNPQVASR